jgi:hypothetical protein
MKNILRITLAATAALTLASTPAFAAPTGATGPNGPATAHAKIIKPLSLEAVANMEFGDITLQGAGTATMAALDGALSCSGGLTCALANGTPAEYTVRGTNNQIVYITKPNVSLTNTVNPGTPLTLVLNGPTQTLLPNSGQNGINFKVGGSIAIADTTLEGDYNGTLAVTVDYQ